MSLRMTEAEKAALPVIPFHADPLDELSGRPGGRKRKIHRYYPSEIQKSEGRGRSGRTDVFANFLMDLANACGGIAPYAFNLSDRTSMSLDWGCIGYLLSAAGPEIELVLDEDGYVAAVRPTAALWARYGRSQQHDLGFTSRIPYDLTELKQRQDIGETTRAVLIDARIGQGRFRDDLLRLWNGRCAVTGCEILEILRASHIRPWSKSTDRERLDPENGVLLSAQLDCLFDRYLISFSNSGEMHVAKHLQKHLDRGLGIGERLRNPPTAKMCSYLDSHRREFFEREGHG